jgi:8-oxo-dGTP pyrophosphatase MutT (NUDIX family)
MALPGGRREKRDRDLLATAVRETREETGAVLSRRNLIGVLDVLEPRTAALPPVSVTPYVFVLPEKPELTLNDELVAAYWFSGAELRESSARVDIPIWGKKPAFVPAPDCVVWGMTHRILTDFFTRADLSKFVQFVRA